MKLSSKEDIEAPLDFVFAALADFETWERGAMRRGAEVNRLDTLRKPGAGMEWQVAFPYRAKTRDVTIKLVKLEQDQTLWFEAVGAPAAGLLMVELLEMGPRRTRLSVSADVKPRTLAARLFLQSLRLAKAKVTKRFSLRLAQLSADIEDRYRATLKS